MKLTAEDLRLILLLIKAGWATGSLCSREIGKQAMELQDKCEYMLKPVSEVGGVSDAGRR